VTGGSPEQLTIAFFRVVLLKDLLESVSPGRGYQPLRAVPVKIKTKELKILFKRCGGVCLANASSLGSRGMGSSISQGHRGNFRGWIVWLATPLLEKQNIEKKLNKIVDIMAEIKANSLDTVIL